VKRRQFIKTLALIFGFGLGQSRNATAAPARNDISGNWTSSNACLHLEGRALDSWGQPGYYRAGWVSPLGNSYFGYAYLNGDRLQLDLLRETNQAKAQFTLFLIQDEGQCLIGELPSGRRVCLFR
jgi:hypothetical protein